MRTLCISTLTLSWLLACDHNVVGRAAADGGALAEAGAVADVPALKRDSGTRSSPDASHPASPADASLPDSGVQPPEATSDAGADSLPQLTYAACGGRALHVGARNGLLAGRSETGRVRLVVPTAPPRLLKPRQGDTENASGRTEQGGSVRLYVDGGFAYAPLDASTTADAFDYEWRTETGRVSIGRVVLSALPLPNLTDRLLLSHGAESYDFTAAEGLLPAGTCVSSGLASVVSARVDTSAGGRAIIKPDGAFIYRPLFGSWGDDEFSFDVQLLSGETLALRRRIVLSPSVLEVEDLATLSTGDAFELRESIAHKSSLSLSGGSDSNGDGLDDLLIGGEGLAYLVYGKTAPKLELFERMRSKQVGGLALRDGGSPDSASWPEKGLYLTASGGSDFNGDGLGDFALAIPEGSEGAGVAELVYQLREPGPDGFVELASVRVGNADGFALLGISELNDGWTPVGQSVAPLGDYNGDGLDDLLVTGGSYSGNASEAYVIFGRPSEGLVQRPLSNVLGRPKDGSVEGVTLALTDIQSGILSVGSAGDADGDGTDDVLLRRGTDRFEDRVYLVLGERSTSSDAALSIAAPPPGRVRYWQGESVGDEAGRSLAGGADFNGDGYPDIAIGAPGAADQAGKVYVLFGGPDGFSPETSLAEVGRSIPGFMVLGDANLRVGASLSALGDINGDGLDDLLLGTETRPGQALSYLYAMYGRSTTDPLGVERLRDGSAGFTIRGAAEAPIGELPSSAGDMNGDGFDDFAFGVPDRGPFGSTFVILGGNFLGTAQSGQERKRLAKSGVGMDVLMGGLGNNVLVHDGGPDVLIGGPGNDTFVLNGPMFGRLRGGHGTDSVKLRQPDMSLDLTHLPPLSMTGVEIIDATGAGTNTITLNEVVLRRLPSSLRAPGRDYSLLIVGDANDQVIVEGGCASLDGARARLRLDTIQCN